MPAWGFAVLFHTKPSVVLREVKCLNVAVQESEEGCYSELVPLCNPQESSHGG